MKNHLARFNWLSHLKLATLTLSSLILLSGCGFQLRGSYLDDSQLEKIYLASGSEYSQLSRAMKTQLRAFGVDVVSTPDDTIPTLYLGQESYETRTLSLYSDGETAEYEISYQVESHLTSPSGDEIPINIQLHRDFLSNTLEALAEQRKVELIYNELRTMAVNQILRDIASAEY